MFCIFPKRVKIETSMTPAQCRNKLGRELVDYHRRPSLVAASQFLKKHRLECCYFGSCEKDGRVEIFYHRAKKYDGSSAGFFGHIEKLPQGKGAVVTGSIRRTAAVAVTAVVWTIVLLAMILALVAMKEYTGAAVTAAVFAAGLGLMLYDRSEEYIRKYLETFPELESAENGDADKENENG